MTNFGTDEETALKEIRKLADAIDSPVCMFFHNGVWWGVAAVKLLGTDLSGDIVDYKIIKPKETEKP